MTIAKSNKPLYETEAVTKDDGVVVRIKRCALNDLDTLLDLQDKLIKLYVEEDGALGTMMNKPDVVETLSSLCSLLPIVEKSKDGSTQYLAFEDISDNWEQLVLLFFNGSIDIKTRAITDISPSKVSDLHFLPFSTLAGEYLRERMEKQKKEQEKRKGSQS